jgi:dUTP pyrophosphatase
MKLRILKLHPNAQVPSYATEGAACFDLYAAEVNGASFVGDVCYPGHPVIVDTGLAFEVPDGYMLRIASRSGLAFKHSITAFPGVIDSDFRAAVKVLLTCNHLDEDTPPVKINPGDRVAQAYLEPAPRVTFEVAEQLSLTARGEGGFGSTGVV